MQRQVNMRFDVNTMTDRAACPFCGTETIAEWPKGPEKGFATIIARCQHERMGMVVDGGNGPTIIFEGPQKAETGEVHKTISELAEVRPGETVAEFVRRLVAERDALQETLTTVEHAVAQVYGHFSGGKLTKCNTDPAMVIAVIEDEINASIVKMLDDELRNLGR